MSQYLIEINEHSMIPANYGKVKTTQTGKNDKGKEKALQNLPFGMYSPFAGNLPGKEGSNQCQKGVDKTKNMVAKVKKIQGSFLRDIKIEKLSGIHRQEENK